MKHIKAKRIEAIVCETVRGEESFHSKLAIDLIELKHQPNMIGARCVAHNIRGVDNVYDRDTFGSN